MNKPKYNIGDIVWLIHEDNIFKGCILEPNNPELNTWFLYPEGNGVAQNLDTHRHKANCVSRSEDRLFETKEDLFDSFR